MGSGSDAQEYFFSFLTYSIGDGEDLALQGRAAERVLGEAFDNGLFHMRGREARITYVGYYPKGGAASSHLVPFEEFKAHGSKRKLIKKTLVEFVD